MPRSPYPDPAGYDPRYPLGPFRAPAAISPELLQDALLTLSQLPEQLRSATRGLRESRLDTPYRDGGWTVRQVVHHVADSHMTGMHRAKRTLTEDTPEVSAYQEQRFAQLADMRCPIEWSLDLLEGLHARWVLLLETLGDAEWAREMRHSENGLTRLDTQTLHYAWHSLHHTAHITHLRRRMGW